MPSKTFLTCCCFWCDFLIEFFSHCYYQTWAKSSTISIYVCIAWSVCSNSLIIRKGSACNLSYKSGFYPIWYIVSYTRSEIHVLYSIKWIVKSHQIQTRCSLFDYVKIRVEHKLCINIVITGRRSVRKSTVCFKQYLFLGNCISHEQCMYLCCVYNAYNVCKNITWENWQSFSFIRQVRQTCLFIEHKILSHRFIYVALCVCIFEIYTLI